MNRLFVFAALLIPFASSFGQQAPPPPPPSEGSVRIDARREVVINWSLGDQVWLFNDIAAAYEPVRGFLEERPSQGNLAVWRLRLVKEFEEGTIRLHEDMKGSPFKIVLLDKDRTVVNSDPIPVQITPVSGRMGDTIEVYIGLPDAQLLRDVKIIRVQRRTDVGF